jgi:hypothetical protein
MFSSANKLNTDYISITTPTPVAGQTQYITTNIQYPCTIARTIGKSVVGTGIATVRLVRDGIPIILFSQSFNTTGVDSDIADINLIPGDSLRHTWDVVTGLVMPTLEITTIRKR